MEYNTCAVRFPRKIKSEYKAVSVDVNGIYNSSLLGNQCPLFDELDVLSNEMDRGFRVKLD